MSTSTFELYLKSYFALVDYNVRAVFLPLDHKIYIKGEQYWKRLFKRVKKGTKTMISHIILPFHLGLQLKEISFRKNSCTPSLLIDLQEKGKSLLIDVGGREEDWS